MKYLISLLSLFFLTSCSPEYKPEKDLSLYELKSKVNHVSIYHFKAYEENSEIKKGKKDLSGEQDKTISFNKKGFITQIYFYGQSDSLDTKVIRELDDKGNCLKELKYNANEQLIGEWNMTYDERGRKIQKGRLLNNGNIFNYAFFHYDDKNRLISRKDFLYLDSQLYDSLVWTYDKRDRQVTEERYGYRGKTSMTKLSYIGQSELADSLFLYDNKGDLANIILIEYNKQGHMTKAIQYNADTILIANVEIDYKYDSKKNWIKKTQFFNQKAQQIIERKIIYY